MQRGNPTRIAQVLEEPGTKTASNGHPSDSPDLTAVGAEVLELESNPNRIALTIRLAVLALTLVACGGGAVGTNSTVGAIVGETASTQPAIALDTTTTNGGAVETTTTAMATTTTAEEGTTDLGVADILPECLAAISSVLQTFEPVVRDVVWETATIEDHIKVMTDLAATSFVDTVACDDVQLDVATEEGSALFLEVAEQAAPGAVGYFTAIIDINDALGGRAATGECAMDIVLFEEVVAEGMRWVDLPLPEQWYVMNLMGSIGFCSLQTQGELRFRPEVEAFLAGSPFAGS